MGKTDTVWKTYLEDDRRFADLINGILFQGAQMVKADAVEDTDTQIRNQKGRLRQRDTARKVRFGTKQAQIGIECEEYIDYSMPLRDLDYNVGAYEKQVARIRRQVKENRQGLREGEWLYRFKKDSRVYPSVTIILYCGKEEWDGAETLHEMTDFAGLPSEIRVWTQDYRIHLIEVRKWKDTKMFQTDVRQVFDFIRYSTNKTALKKLITEDPYYQRMEEDAWDVMARYASVGNLIEVENYYREDGKIDMCTALKELLEDERKAGEKIGREQGEKMGERRAEERHIRSLMKSMDLTREQAVAALNIREKNQSVSVKKRNRRYQQRKRK